MENTENDMVGAFARLFDGYEKRHLELSANVTKDDKGKVNAKARTVDGPITRDLVEAHLNAEASIGVAPVKSDSTCSWGVLDIDVCDMSEDDVRKVADRVRTRCAAFRSKSRGLHVYLFASEPVPARVMHEYLVAVRKRLPRPIAKQTETFPKAGQVHVAPDNEPTAVNLPIHGQQREFAFAVTHEGVRWALDDMPLPDLLDSINRHCRTDAETLTQIAKEQPVLDTSEIGYRVPHNPAGRNDLLMRIAMSMQARGWDNEGMKAELYRLNREGERFHEVFDGKGQLPDAEIEAMLKQAWKREKGTPTPLSYRQVEKFNREWAVIDLNGKIEYLRKTSPVFTTYNKDDLMAKTAHQQVQIGKHRVPLAKLWLEDPDRSEFDGVVCEPLHYDGPGYNVFRGFKVAPRDGDASIFESYILDVLCSGDEGLARWVTMWLADMVQRPTEPSPTTALALRGPQGAGKSFLQEQVLSRIFHDRQHHVVFESKRLFGQFNRELFGCTVVACEESIFHGSKSDADTLKSFISSPGWVYEAKFKAAFRAKNVHRLIATTNHVQAVHLEGDDRRWTVIEVSQRFDLLTEEGKKEAYDFWEPYHAFIKSEDGPGIVLRYLLDYPVDRRELAFPYGTKAKARDKLLSDPVVAVLHEIAENGICPHDTVGAGVISIKTLAELVHQAGGRRMSPEEIAHKLKNHVPHVERSRSARYCSREHTGTNMDGDAVVTPLIETRQRGYALGSLDEFRAAVARITECEYGADDEALPEGYDPTDFDLEQTSGWRAWVPPQKENPNGPPPF